MSKYAPFNCMNVDPFSKQGIACWQEEEFALYGDIYASYLEKFKKHSEDKPKHIIMITDGEVGTISPTVFAKIHPESTVVKSWKNGEIWLMENNRDIFFVKELFNKDGQFYTNTRDGAIRETIESLKKKGTDLIAFYTEHKGDMKVFHDSHLNIFRDHLKVLDRLISLEKIEPSDLSEIPVAVWIILSGQYQEKVKAKNVVRE